MRYFSLFLDNYAGIWGFIMIWFSELLWIVKRTIKFIIDIDYFYFMTLVKWLNKIDQE